MWSTVWNNRVFNWCCPCANCACQDNCDGVKIMLLPLLLPFGGWLATGQSTPATYGNEGRWFNHSWFIRRPVCCCVYAHKRERLSYVRTQLPPSIRDCCGVLAQLCRQMKIVSTCIDGESFSLRLSFSFTVDYWPNHEVTAVGNETLVFIIQSPSAILSEYHGSYCTSSFTCYNIPQFSNMLGKKWPFEE